MKVFNLPDLGEGLPDAQIREWHIKPGDIVEIDQPLVAMETAKAVVEVPSPWAGEIGELHGSVDDIIDTGAPLITFKTVTSTHAEKKDTGTVVGHIERTNAVVPETAQIMERSATSTQIKATPAVKQLAKQLNVDLSHIVGTGPNNTITAQDVKNATQHAHTHTTTVASDYEPLKGVRRSMMQAMVKSHQEIVPATIFDEADIAAWANDQDITLRIIRAICHACKFEPSLNAWYDSKAQARKLFADVNLGLAIDSDEGLFVPVIEKAQNNSELRNIINTYKAQVKDRSIPTEKLSGATISLSNFGVFAGQFATPVVVPPQVAIIGIGKIKEMAVVQQGQIAVHRVIPISLTFDHRAVTGGEASRFLFALIQDLKEAN
ncbi:MAG: dihydrolipoamide acetyltransferase family protein [Gammaproteobacteria bacterium]|jgi:pyruvate dehydrogenase E2 component (dihydrolipoamide acetyltransferase)